MRIIGSGYKSHTCQTIVTRDDVWTSRIREPHTCTNSMQTDSLHDDLVLVTSCSLWQIVATEPQLWQYISEWYGNRLLSHCWYSMTEGCINGVMLCHVAWICRSIPLPHVLRYWMTFQVYTRESKSTYITSTGYGFKEMAMSDWCY